jgi:hypothetical protein
VKKSAAEKARLGLARRVRLGMLGFGSRFGCAKRVTGASFDALRFASSFYAVDAQAADRGGGEKPISFTSLRRFYGRERAFVARAGHAAQAETAEIEIALQPRNGS